MVRLRKKKEEEVKDPVVEEVTETTEEVINIDDIPTEVEEELSKETLIAMYGVKPEEAPIIPQTHGEEEAL